MICDGISSQVFVNVIIIVSMLMKILLYRYFVIMSCLSESPENS